MALLRSDKVSAVIVTRGDCDLAPLVASLPFPEIAVWDNSRRPDRKVYGRYLAAAEAGNDIIYTQDDDCIVDAQALLEHYEDGLIVANVPEDRRAFYSDGVTLVGWGALFHRSLLSVLDRYLELYPMDELFLRECDRLFTGLNRTRCVEVPLEHLPRAFARDRMGMERIHLADLAEIRRRTEELR